MYQAVFTHKSESLEVFEILVLLENAIEFLSF